MIPGSTIVSMTARSYFARLLFVVPAYVATLIVAILLLKLVRITIKIVPKS